MSIPTNLLPNSDDKQLRDFLQQLLNRIVTLEKQVEALAKGDNHGA